MAILFGSSSGAGRHRVGSLADVQGRGASASGRGAARVRLGKFLVVAQVAISCVLLAGAVLFARSFQTLTNLDSGFQPENVLLLNVFTLKAGPQGVERVRLYERVLERLSRVPGIRSTLSFPSESLFGGAHLDGGR